MTYQSPQTKPALKTSNPAPADKNAQPDGSQKTGNPKSDGESCATGACSTDKQSSKPKKDKEKE